MENIDLPTIPESKEAKLNVKKVDWLKVSIAAVIIIAVVIAGYMLFAKSGSNSSLKSGDSANMEFTFIVDGKTIVSNESIFKVGSIGSQFGMDSSKIDDAVTGLKNGESVTVKFNSSEAYGAYDPTLIQILNRTEIMPKFEELNRTITITSDVFNQAFSETPVLNKIYSPEGAPWDYKVVSFDGSSVVMSQEPEVGKIIPLNDFMYVKVTGVTSTTITTERILNEENKVIDSATGNVTIYSDAENIYFKLTPIVNETISLGTAVGMVLSFNETSMVFDTNNPYAGKEVELIFKVLEIKSSEPAQQQAQQGSGSYTEADLKKLTKFSNCLADKGIVVYGANWCGWTKKLVVETLGGFDIAGSAYVECTENEAKCSKEGVTGYPTIKQNGEVYQGGRTLADLSQATGCAVPELEGSQVASQQASQAQTGYTDLDLTKISKFSECLSEKGVKVYGANWCGWTKKFVVETLGGFDTVAPIYVECTENEAECSDVGVTSYPTTQINGEPYLGARTIEGLASATGCVAPELEGTQTGSESANNAAAGCGS